MSRELTTEESIKYKKEINRSRLTAAAYVHGYKMKEMIDEINGEIVTLAKGEEGWVPVGHCEINKQQLILDNKRFHLDPNLIQVSKKGHEFKVIGLEKDPNRKPKGWGYNLQYCWIVNVRFVESGAIVAYYFDYSENFVKRKLINTGYRQPQIKD